ncbi:conserved hypothetical protein [Culex quinquefasciatus]|uniref:Uncharacterized protein n=1 Tax=Culex quinquefasciatus TaxID=7176 RepID=B0W109_CULQU|nr:conserved hypothetical protein [Culex quinquefasciatus]|eukprot:XP_001842393.1 conserved hypothetical protein [Culex quinquefasciatus]
MLEKRRYDLVNKYKVQKGPIHRTQRYYERQLKPPGGSKSIRRKNPIRKLRTKNCMAFRWTVPSCRSAEGNVRHRFPHTSSSHPSGNPSGHDQEVASVSHLLRRMYYCAVMTIPTTVEAARKRKKNIVSSSSYNFSNCNFKMIAMKTKTRTSTKQLTGSVQTLRLTGSLHPQAQQISQMLVVRVRPRNHNQVVSLVPPPPHPPLLQQKPQQARSVALTLLNQQQLYSSPSPVEQRFAIPNVIVPLAGQPQQVRGEVASTCGRGITTMGDFIAILCHSKTVCIQSAIDRVLSSQSAVVEGPVLPEHLANLVPVAAVSATLSHPPKSAVSRPSSAGSLPSKSRKDFFEHKITLPAGGGSTTNIVRIDGR